MLIESLLIGGIAGCLSYACKIVYSNMVAEDSSVEVDNIVKYEYHPIDYIEQVGLKDKIIFKYIEGEKDGVKAFVGYDMEDNLKAFDMLEGHTIVGGASRWGKSSFLNVFITNITKTYTRMKFVF